MTTARAGDLYEILGVDRHADEKTIKAAYRKLAKKYHPDMHPGDAEAERKFKEVNAAWQILSDRERRRLYDAYGPVSLEEGFDEALFKRQREGRSSRNGSVPFDFGGPGRHFHFEGVDDDILQEIFGGMFGGMFDDDGGYVFTTDDGSGMSGWGDAASGGAGRRTCRHAYHTPQRGHDLEMEAEIPFTIAALGGEVRVQTPDGAVMCRIPAGIQDGTKIRLKGRGAPGHGSGAAHGDLYLRIRIRVPKHLSDAARQKLHELEPLL